MFSSTFLEAFAAGGGDDCASDRGQTGFTADGLAVRMSDRVVRNLEEAFTDVSRMRCPAISLVLPLDLEDVLVVDGVEAIVGDRFDEEFFVFIGNDGDIEY